MHYERDGSLIGALLAAPIEVCIEALLKACIGSLIDASIVALIEPRIAALVEARIVALIEAPVEAPIEARQSIVSNLRTTHIPLYGECGHHRSVNDQTRDPYAP